MKCMIVVTHLLGTGHLARAAILARGIQSEGGEVVLVSGGMTAHHIDLGGLRVVQLPPVRADGTNFARLLDANGSEVTGDYLASRRKLLLDTLVRENPDALVTELYPFGRRMLRDEFGTLLQAAKAQPCVIAASIRDILNPPSTPKKAAWTDEMLTRFYDAVLIHADPDVIGLDESWPVSAAIKARCRYTGFVAPPPPKPIAEGAGEVLVSAGGGPVGNTLFDAACGAAQADASRNWRLFVGGAEAAERIARLNESAPRNLVAHPTRPEYRDMMCNAAASVSFCGYNTALDLLQSGVPAVVVPFDDGGEVEQGLRAQALAKLKGLEVVESDALTPENLLSAIDRVVSLPRRTPRRHGLDGAGETARILDAMVRKRGT